MNKVLWFSRHDMTQEQLSALGEVEVTKVNVGNLPNVHVPFEGEVNGETKQFPPFKELMQEYDIVAIVAPISLQQQILGVAGDKPVIMAKNRRVLVQSPDGGEAKVTFVFDGWEQLLEIKVVLVPYQPL